MSGPILLCDENSRQKKSRIFGKALMSVLRTGLLRRP